MIATATTECATTENASAKRHGLDPLVLSSNVLTCAVTTVFAETVCVLVRVYLMLQSPTTMKLIGIWDTRVWIAPEESAPTIAQGKALVMVRLASACARRDLQVSIALVVFVMTIAISMVLVLTKKRDVFAISATEESTVKHVIV